MSDLILYKISDRDQFFSDVAAQLLKTIEEVCRRGYMIGLELRNPSSAHADGQTYVEVWGYLALKNNNTGNYTNVSLVIKEHDKIGRIGSEKISGPTISLQASSSVFGALYPTFMIQSPSDSHSWVCTEKIDQVCFDDALLYMTSLYGNEPDPLQKTSFRGFRTVPLSDTNGAERPKEKKRRRSLANSTPRS